MQPQETEFSRPDLPYYEIQFTQIRKGNPCPWHALWRVGGTNSNGSIWNISTEKALELLQKEKMGFYLIHENQPFEVKAAHHYLGYEYLSTELDDEFGRNYAIMYVRGFPV